MKQLFDHILRVQSLIHGLVHELLDRAHNHDLSKFSPEEYPHLKRLQELIDTHGPVDYGTPEYSERTKLLGPMLKHHYEHNRHHPEHHAQGVAGMTLIDVIEMLADWKAASERGEHTDTMNLNFALDKYKVEGQLRQIIINTVKEQGWKE